MPTPRAPAGRSDLSFAMSIAHFCRSIMTRLLISMPPSCASGMVCVRRADGAGSRGGTQQAERQEPSCCCMGALPFADAVGWPRLGAIASREQREQRRDGASASDVRSKVVRGRTRGPRDPYSSLLELFMKKKAFCYSYS